VHCSLEASLVLVGVGRLVHSRWLRGLCQPGFLISLVPLEHPDAQKRQYGHGSDYDPETP